MFIFSVLLSTEYILHLECKDNNIFGNDMVNYYRAG